MNQNTGKSRAPKRRSGSHIQGERGVDSVSRLLPNHWVIRELNPDYGLDLHIETFVKSTGLTDQFDALGEHFFAQVKTEQSVRYTSIKPFEPHIPGLLTHQREDDPHAKIPVISYSVETELVETVRRMGSSIPVLLLLRDELTASIFYICFTDWVSKILPAWRPDWAENDTVTIHIPAGNKLDEISAVDYLSALALRPKLYGAFQFMNSIIPEFIVHPTQLS